MTIREELEVAMAYELTGGEGRRHGSRKVNYISTEKF
jgi:hypothetical protein